MAVTNNLFLSAMHDSTPKRLRVASHCKYALGFVWIFFFCFISGIWKMCLNRYVLSIIIIPYKCFRLGLHSPMADKIARKYSTTNNIVADDGSQKKTAKATPASTVPFICGLRYAGDSVSVFLGNTTSYTSILAKLMTKLNNLLIFFYLHISFLLELVLFIVNN